MSACISSRGEYSEHEMDETGFACLHCGFDDIEAMCARIAQLEAAAEERSGWRPPAQMIETPENGGDYAAAIAALNALPSGAVARVRRDVFQSIGSGWWEAIGRRRSFSSEQVVDLADGDSVVVLEYPAEKAGQ